jgi:acetylornithine/succinyldiaminopimelate/putrescine aminotransferase
MTEPAVSPAAAATPAKSALLDVFHQSDVAVERGEGVYVFDSAGRRYLDCYGGHAVALLGYGHPRVCAALDEQARKLFFQSNLFDLEIRRRAAAALARFAPAGLDQVFFVNSGAEANENALRTAFLVTKRSRVVCLEGGFHGRTAAAGAVTDHNAWYAFPQTPFGVDRIPFGDTAALYRAVDDRTAAVIFEPVQGMAGARPCPPEFVAEARRLCTERGAVLIFDEVQCGMGRSGRPFAAQAYGVTPDILTTAKGVAAGFPAAAMLVGGDLAKAIKKGDLGTTFGGGPMPCALIETVVETLEQEDLLPRVRRLSDRLRREACVGPVVAVQGMGFLLGLRTRPPAKEVLAGLRARGVLAGSSGDPHVVRVLPPLVFEDAHVDQLIAALRELPS